MMPLEFYHVFNRAVGDEKAFITNDNYLYFLRLIKKHIIPIADVYAYTLLPNHYHLLLRIKDDKTIAAYYEALKGKPIDVLKMGYSDVVLQCFSNQLNAYTKAFNNKYNRKGNIFMPNFKRSLAESESDITSFIFYVNKNAVHHGLTEKIGEWAYDSYKSILSSQSTALARDKVISWFGNRDAFIKFHQQPVHLKIKRLEE